MRRKEDKKVKNEKSGSGSNENGIGSGKIRGNAFFLRRLFRASHYLRMGYPWEGK